MCKEQICRIAAAEGSVLLKNEGNLLPFKRGTKLAVFGRAQTFYYKSGTGSGGLVHINKEPCIIESLKENNDLILDKELIELQIGKEGKLTATIEPGVLPIISLASLPTALTSPFLTSTATTDGSRIIMPFVLTQTKVFAVPRSTPISLLKLNKFTIKISFKYSKDIYTYLIYYIIANKY